MRAATANWYEEAPIYEDRTRWLNPGKSIRRPPPPRWEFQQVLREFTAPQGLKLLDVGCGHGEFLYWAKQAGFDIAGVDFNERSLAFAREILGLAEIYNCTVSDVRSRFGTECFDVITMFEVLEHVDAPLDMLQQLVDLIRPNGYLCVSVPGHERWPPLFDRDVDMPPHHLTLWTASALNAALTRIGMKPVEIRRKPLQVSDLGGHLRWRAERLLRRHSKSSPVVDLREHSVRRHVVKLAAEQVLTPVGWVLRLHPKAGGFTLYARARKQTEPLGEGQ